MLKRTLEELRIKHFAMTGNDPSGYCVYENHDFCKSKNEHGRDCTCVCHKHLDTVTGQG